MNQINFLPESFRKVQRRQARRPMEFCVIVATACALVGLWMYSSGPDTTLAQHAETIDQSIQEIQQLREEEARLVSERKAMQRKLMTARETYQPISVTQVLSRLSLIAPDAIRLVNVEVSTQRPEPEKQADPAAKKPKRSRSKDKQPEKVREPSVMRLSITGHAPSDDEVGTLIRRLNADPVFSGVALRSSRTDKTKTHYVRKFQLDVTIDLDRRFLPATDKKTSPVEADDED